LRFSDRPYGSIGILSPVRLVLRGSTATTIFPGSLDVTDNGEIPLTADEHQIDLAVRQRAERGALAADKRNFHPTGNGPGCSPCCRRQTQDAIVVGVRHVFGEFNNTLPLVGLLRRIGVGRLCNTADSGLSSSRAALQCPSVPSSASARSADIGLSWSFATSA
jgi:hypothetical protein